MRSFLVAAALAFSAPAFAGPPELAAAQAFNGQNFEEVAGRLNLSADQKKKLTDLVYASTSKRVDVSARLEKAKIELKYQFAAETVDEKACLKAVDAVSAAEADLLRNKVELMLGIRKVVSRDQWLALVAMRDERRDERREHRRGDE